MNTMHLFAGGGGGLLADLILGHTPIVAVEWDKNACRVLRDRAADGWFPGLHVYEGDVRVFDPSDYAGRVDCIAAGFPCQDISVAGSQLGVGEGRRSGLYREVLRIADIVDRDSSSWRTSQPSLLTNTLAPYSETWPRAGLMRDGVVWRHRESAHRINATDGGAWVPTPTVNGNYNRKGLSKTSGDGLATYARMWPTATLQDSKNCSLPPSQVDRDHLCGALMREGEKVQLNPIWVCWLMNWPLMWTGGAKSQTLAESPKESQTEERD